MYLISHRGNNKHKYIENTYEAINSSLKEKYIDGVEFDIRKTKDNKFVLSHSMFNKEKIIENNKLKDLKLEELENTLKKIKTNKIIIIDLKYERFKYKKYAYYLNKILKKYKYLNIYLCSFNYDLILYIKKRYKYKSGLIISNILNKCKDYDSFDFISVNYRTYKQFKNALMIWTINDKATLKKYQNEKIYVITDKPYLNN